MMITLPLLAALLTTAPVPPLASQFGDIAEAAQGRVGAAVVVLESQEEPMGWLSGYPYPMQSVYKLPIAMAVLHEVDAGRLSLDAPVRIEKGELVPKGAHSPLRDKNPNGTTLALRELVRLAIVESDGTASDVLMRVAGGPETVMSYLKELGITELLVQDTEMQLSRDPKAQYRNTATPSAALALLRALHGGPALSQKSRTLLLQDMTDSMPGAARLKGALPAGTPVAHKTGTSGTEKGVTAATNDIGIITLPDGRHLAIAVFVADAKADQATREGVIAKIARAAWDFYVKP
jgi:beta-lactamase class A